MTKDRSPLKAGLFIIIAIALAVGIIVAIKGVNALFVATDTRKAAFDLRFDVGGLRVGDDVRVGGFKVGVVKAIFPQGLDTPEPKNVIEFTIPKTYPLKQDARLAIQTTVTGTSVLNFDSLGKGEILPADEMLVGRPSALAQAFASLGEAGPAVSSLLTDMRGAIADVRGTTLPKVNNAVEKAGTALDHGGEAMVQIRDVLGDSKPDIRGTLANLNSITAAGKEKIPGLLGRVDELATKITATVDEARGAVADAKATLANAKDTTATLRTVVAGNRGRLDNIISSLKVTSDNLKGASAEVRRSPWRLLYKPQPGEVENLTLFDAARQFSDGATQLNDAATALRDAAKDPNADKATVNKLIEKLDNSFGNFNEVEQKLWKTVRE